MKKQILNFIFLSFSSIAICQEYNPNATYSGTETDPCKIPATTWYLGGNIIAPQLINMLPPPPDAPVSANYPIYNDIGTCNNYDFVLKANNNLTMWIKPNTKVGVGEPIPKAKFEVLETNPLITGRDGVGETKLLLTSIRAKVLNNFQHNEWVLRDLDFPFDWTNVHWHDGISIDNSYLTPHLDTKTWWNRMPINSEQSWGDENQLHLKIKNNYMQIMDQANAPNSSVLNLNVNGGNAFEIFDQGNQRRNFQVLANGITKIGDQPNAPVGSMLNVNVNGGNAFEIYDEGTQKINFKVKANGYCYAREINVMPTNIIFPDYVFEKNYKLKSLESLENYLLLNKHLPNIPSANEVEKNGINLAELQIKELEKIEELFLYVIELKKENDVLKKQINQLKK